MNNLVRQDVLLTANVNLGIQVSQYLQAVPVECDGAVWNVRDDNVFATQQRLDFFH